MGWCFPCGVAGFVWGEGTSVGVLWDLLANPYFQVPAIPLLLLLLKPLVKKLTAGPRNVG